MKYVNKISVLLSLLMVILFSACNTDRKDRFIQKEKVCRLFHLP